MRVTFDVRHDCFPALAKKEAAMKCAIVFDVSSAVRADTDPYVPFRDGDLAGSAYVASNMDEGRIVYGNTVNKAGKPVNSYAKRQYYDLPNKSKLAHPKATGKWAEVSKGNNLAKWQKVAEQAAMRVLVK